MSADVEAWLAARRIWRPKDIAGAPHVPTSAKDAARRFHCTRIAGSLTGEDCVNSYIRGTSEDTRRAKSATTCTGCEAGAARQELLGIEGSAKERKLEAMRLPPDYHALLGRIPDAVVAARAGVPTQGAEIARNKLQIPRYRGPESRPAGGRFDGPVNWSAQPLGKLTDVEVAERLWFSSRTVSNARQRLGIPAAPRCKPIDWDAQPLGQVPDCQIASDLSIWIARVRAARKERGIGRAPTGVDWDAEPLGEVPDAELAANLGRSVRHVAKQRRQRGILEHKPAPKIDWDAQPLGEISDPEIASRLGITTGRVWYARNARGIPPFVEKKSWDDQPLGKIPDAELAERLGVAKKTVAKQRRRRGIKAVRAPHSCPFDPKSEHLGAAPDTVIAARLGVSVHSVWWHRSKLGIPAYQVRVDWDAQPLGEISDKELAERLGVGFKLVSAARRKRGIPAYRYRVDVDWDAQPLGVEQDQVIADRLGVCLSTVRRARRERKIGRAPVGVDWDEQPLGEVDDSVIAERTGLTVNYVAQRRQALGIPPADVVAQECPVTRLGRLGKIGRMALAHISDLKDPAHDARMYLKAIAGDFGSPESIAATCGPAWDSRALRQLPGTKHTHKGIRYLMRCSVWVGEVEQHTQGWRLSGAGPTVGATDVTTAADLWVKSGVKLPMISLKHIMLLTHWSLSDAKAWLKRETEAGRLAQIGRAGGTMYRRRR